MTEVGTHDELMARRGLYFHLSTLGAMIIIASGTSTAHRCFQRWDKGAFHCKSPGAPAIYSRFFNTAG